MLLFKKIKIDKIFAWIYKSKYVTNLILVLGSLFFILIIILLGEVLVRSFTNINFLGHSARMFLPNAYGSSIGYIKNGTGISFGVKIYTDENGFRVTKKTWFDRSKFNKKEAILILGDSVAFGVGVDADSTFVGLLSKKFPAIQFYNSSVIGYNTNDYKNIIKYFYPQHKQIKHVYLLFCLNDISNISAQELKNTLDDENKGVRNEESFIYSLKNIGFIDIVNRFLRSHSKLYIYIKSLLTDAQSRYWQADYLLYKNATSESIQKALNPILYIADKLEKNNVDFSVIILPYEYQLRKDSVLVRLPQTILSEFFIKKGIPFIDAFQAFSDQPKKSSDLFLYNDPMHLSEAGHKIIFDIIQSNLKK